MDNLLLDVRLFDGDGTFMSQLDSHDDASDGIARVFTQSSNENGVTATFGTKLTDGYVTRFGYTVVPEPPTRALLGVALVSLSIARRGRRTRRSAEAGSGRTLER